MTLQQKVDAIVLGIARDVKVSSAIRDAITTAYATIEEQARRIEELRVAEGEAMLVVESAEHKLGVARERIAKLEGYNERMLTGLREIEARGDKCHCDQGYPGGCGCGRRMADMAIDARCPTPTEYGACGICDECRGHNVPEGSGEGG